MRIAILSDIHGNRTAFEAVLADLQQTSPDLILHGGDLADAGASPVEIVDRIRDLGWKGVVGNTDEMLFRPESLEEFASQSSAPLSLWTAIRQMAAATRALLELESVYRPLNQPIAVYAHIHRPYIRSVPSPQVRQRLVANTGSVSLSYDGNRRASYLLLDGRNPTIRRVDYDVEKELKALSSCGLPHADWIAKSLHTGSFQMP